jgi:hypothetical protein
VCGRDRGSRGGSLERRGCWRGEERGRARRLKRWIADCEGRTGLAMQKLPVNDLALGRVRRCRLRGQWENRCARRPCVHSCASQQVVLVVGHAQSTLADSVAGRLMGGASIMALRCVYHVAAVRLSCRAMAMAVAVPCALASNGLDGRPEGHGHGLRGTRDYTKPSRPPLAKTLFCTLLCEHCVRPPAILRGRLAAQHAMATLG